MVSGNAFAKTICSICYEDLKPITEDLQAISICGHVFHELCLQQWFEYCSSEKKRNCPVCKQTCSEANVCRLYFQSVGDQGLSQKHINREENPEELRREIERLEEKVSGLSSALECCKKDVKELNAELRCSKEQAGKEAALKNEAMQQRWSIQQLFDKKATELDEKTSECKRLDRKNKALANELAELTMALDSNLGKEKILKLASLLNEANNKGNIDKFSELLDLRNKWYNELISKCNDLGRGKADSLRKLEKKERKINKLKARIQELEIAVEVKDNEVLRALKATKKTTRAGGILTDTKRDFNSSSIDGCLDHHLGEPAEQEISFDQNGTTARDLFTSRKLEKFKPSKDVCITKTNDRSTIALGKVKDSYILIDENASTVIHENPEAASDTKGEVHRSSNKDPISGLKSGTKCDTIPTSTADLDDDTVLLLDDIKQVQSFVNTDKEFPCQVPFSQPGDICFAGGVIGPDGTRMHLGKWCKRVEGKGSATSSLANQGSNLSTGNLIAVGADGRGGKIKVLRSQNQSTLDSCETSTSAKRCKYGAKTSTSQSQGCLRIEHFFGRPGQ